MPRLPFPVTLLLERLDTEAWLGEALLFPSVSRLAGTRSQVRAATESVAVSAAADLPPVSFYRYVIQTRPEVAEVVLALEPPRRQESWRDALDLTFHAVRWSPGPRWHLAWVPALSLMVQSRRLEDMDAVLQEEIRACLLRSGAAASLRSLAWLQRLEAVEIQDSMLTVDVKDPKARARAERTTPEASVLKEVASDLSEGRLRAAWEVDADLSRLADLLRPPSSRSVLLVGDSGTGKTARIHQLVRSRRLEGYKLWATSGARLVSASGDWEERVGRLLREVKGSRTILVLGNLLELTRVGKSEGNTYGVASLLRPAIARGDLLVIAECTPEQKDLLWREDPALVEAFADMPIREPEEPVAARILDAADARSQLTAQAMDVLLRLHRRYATYSAWPGRPLRFLYGLLNGQVETVAADTVIGAFSAETGLPRVLLDPQVPMARDETLAWFEARVLEQAEAVQAVVDLLLVIKATLHRPRRPLASFLLIGPTGVGKTETARTLAEFLFSDRHRMVRFDMSEYALPHAVDRLLGLLVSKVREQPFCVLLFDEVEKAHPLFFDLLLQVLGDGRLTDPNGRLADFRNSVVIMTSNLGAQEYLQGDAGFLQDRDVVGRARQHFLHAVQSFLRPELYNRIDRIIPFSPLSRDGATRLVQRELERLLQREGIKYRNVSVSLDDSLVDWVVEHSFDRRYGARALRRFLEQHILVRLADSLNRHDSKTRIDFAGRIVDHKLWFDTVAAAKAPSPVDASWLSLARDIQKLRRDAQKLERCSLVNTLHNQYTRLSQQRRQTQGDRLRRLEGLLTMVERLSTRLQSAEDDVLNALYDDRHDAERPPLQGLTGDFTKALYAVYAQKWPDALVACVGVFGESARFKRLLTEAVAVAGMRSEEQGRIAPLTLFSQGWTLALSERRPDADVIHIIKLLRRVMGCGLAEAKAIFDRLPARPPLIVRDDFTRDEALAAQSELKEAGGLSDVRETGEKLVIGTPQTGEEFLRQPPSTAVGWAVEVRGPLAWPRLAGEAGLHIFIDKGQRSTCVLDTAAETLERYQPPADAHRRAFAEGKTRRRTYDLSEQTITDGTRRPWSGELAPALAALLDERLRQAALLELDS